MVLMTQFTSHAVLLALALAGCAGSQKSQPSEPAPSAAASLVGTFHRADERGTVMRFAPDGTCSVASSMEELAEPSHRCTWTLDGSRLTFTNTQGSCAETESTRVGVYDVVVRAQDVSFKKVTDTCERRMSIDGETWQRLAN
jgi:hypothetical protein